MDLLTELGTQNEYWPAIIGFTGILVGIWSLYDAFWFAGKHRVYILCKGIVALFIGLTYYLLATDDLTPLITRGIIRPTIEIMLISYWIDTILRKF